MNCLGNYRIGEMTIHGDTTEVTTVEYGHETHSKLRVLDLGGDLEASGHPYELAAKPHAGLYRYPETEPAYIGKIWRYQRDMWIE